MGHIQKKSRKVSIPVPWTPEQDARLSDLWGGETRIKEHLDEFGGHTWDAISRRASTLRLGKRPNAPKGQAPIAWPLIERALRNSANDRFTIADLVNLSAVTVHKQLKRAAELGLVYVREWRRRPATKMLVPVYSLGKRRSMPKPQCATPAEKQRALRSRGRVARAKSGERVRGFNPFATIAQQVTA